MSIEELRALARLHGIVAWLATGALVAGVWLLRGRSVRRGVVIAVSAVIAVSITLAGLLGLLLDDAYRSRLRQRLFIEAPQLGSLFERKEHLAFGAILLGWSGLFSLSAALLLAAPRPSGAEGELRERLASELRLAAKVGWLAAALSALFASIASALVTRRASF